MTYNEYGMQDTLKDPNAGIMTYSYNSIGELLTQKNNRGQQTTMTYDNLGRVQTKTSPEGTVTYTYDNALNGMGLLASVTSTNQTITYTYDNFSRLLTETNTIDGTAYPTTFEYDNSVNKVSKIIYPSQFSINNEYEGNGFLKRVRRSDNNAIIWESTSVNQFGQNTGATFGNSLVINRTYDKYGFPVTMKTGTTQNIGSIQNLQFCFDTTSGNLSWRKDNISSRNFTESFTYDHNRLTNSLVNPSTNYNVQYDDDQGNFGNISYKFGAGTYAYTSSRPHAVTQLTNSPIVNNQYITYNSFEQPTVLSEGNWGLTISYGVDEQRIKSVYTQSGTNWTRKYIGNYEEVWSNSQITKKIHYIAGGDGLVAVYIIDGSGNGQMYYISKDYLGSIMVLTRQDGTVAEEYSYDSWGRRRSPTNWTNYTVSTPTLLYRGYTGHEHLDEFALINMNGRCYDSRTGRFLSPDNYVQIPDFTQSFNRYAYCLNNPLISKDPTGEFFMPFLSYIIAHTFFRSIHNGLYPK
ncbi:MAG: hypothetical protein HC905_25870 [Bacteroidales bacterium]|nr:hypothetical protein [Bacteroidales bacterium]